MSEVARGALESRLPSIDIVPDYAEAGGLMSYGAPLIEDVRRAATYVDKILTGARPAQLPFEQPTNYRRSVNMKTAKALGLTIPQSVLLASSSERRVATGNRSDERGSRGPLHPADRMLP